MRVKWMEINGKGGQDGRRDEKLTKRKQTRDEREWRNGPAQLYGVDGVCGIEIYRFLC